MDENLKEIKRETLDFSPETVNEGFLGRMRTLAAALGYRSMQSFQTSLGFSNSYFRNIGKLNREAESRIKKVHPEANIDYLRTGEGEVLLKDVEEMQREQKEVNYVPLLPVYSIGGSLNDFEPSVMDWECETIVCPVKGATRAITVLGDSMSPEYPNGCIVFIQKINEAAFIEWGKTYVLDTENGVIVKNVFPCIDDPEKVICRSVNQNYADFVVAKQYINGWWRVLCQMSRK